MRPVESRWNLSETPLLLPAMGLAAGIAICGLSAGEAIWILVVSAIAGIAMGLWRGFPHLVVLLTSVLIGVGAYVAASPGPADIGRRVSAVGEVVDSQDYESSQRCVVVIPDGARIAVTVYDSPFLVEPGDSVAFSGLLLPPTRETTVPDELDGSNYAMVNRVSAVCMAVPEDFRIVAPASGVRGWLNRLRSSLTEGILYSGMSENASRFLLAVLVGEDRVDPEVKEDFSRAGLSHILAISGTHVATVIFLVSFLLFPVEMAGFRKWKITLMIFCLWGYALLTGMSPSVVRAVIMASFILVGKLTGRYSNSFNSLCGAALLILLFRPMSLFRVGFQLSFLAVAGILMVMPQVRDWVAGRRWGKNRLVYGLVCMVALPVSAVVATSPLSAWHFHYSPIWFLVSNLPVALMLPLILCGGAVLLLVTSLGLHSGILAGGVEGLYDLTECLARFVSSLPGNGDSGSIYFPAWLLLPVYAGLFLMWLGWIKGRKSYIVNGMIVLSAGVVMSLSPAKEYPSEECHVWRNNRGVAVVCRDGGEAYIVTDASPKYYPEIREQAEFRLRDYLARRDAVLAGVIGDSLDLAWLRIERGRWMIEGKCFTVLHGIDDMIPSEIEEADYVIVAGGFKGDVAGLREIAPESLLVLSPSLPPLRRKRYAGELSGMDSDYLFDIPPAVFADDDNR